MIVIVDYGMGNTGSILNMLKKIGEKSLISSDPEEITKADKLILPGVGSFDMGMINLRNLGLDRLIMNHALTEKKPILGICLGMQMLGRKSEEGKEKGLGLIPFDNIRFRIKPDQELKIPHMGWDYVTIKREDSLLLSGIAEKQRYYFVHSFHAVPDNDENVLMECEYGYHFAAAVCKENIYGVQFHPEKSHKYGMALLENFARRC